MLEFIRGTSTEYLNQSVVVCGCGLWDADGDGMCVGDGSVMDSRSRSFFSSNQNGLFFRKS